MSDFKVAVTRVDGVDHHPNADRLSLITIKGYAAISAKLEDGSHRYKAGDYIAYIPEGSILPEWLLKRLDMWNHDLNKGGLSNAALYSVSLVPEPHTYSLILAGLVAVGFLARRRKAE
jgi:hypothetical protein